MQGTSSGSGIERFLYLLRAVGISVMAFDQEPGTLGRFVLGASTKLIFRVSGLAAQYIGWMLGFSREQIKALSELPTGTCVAVFSDDRLSRPFTIQFPKAPDVRHLGMAQIDELSRRSLEPWMSRVIPEHVEQPSAQSTPQTVEDLLTENGFAIFKRIAEEPPETIDERWRALPLGSREEEGIARDESIRHGLLMPVDETAGNRYRFWVLTQKGVSLAKQLGIKVYAYKSGPAHEWTLVKVEETLNALDPDFEFRRGDSSLGNRQPDRLLLLPGASGHRVVIQAVCSRNFQHEAQALLDMVALPTVALGIAVASTTKHRTSLQRSLKAEAKARAEGKALLDKIRMTTVTECLKPGFDWTALLHPLWPPT